MREGPPAGGTGGSKEGWRKSNEVQAVRAYVPQGANYYIARAGLRSKRLANCTLWRQTQAGEPAPPWAMRGWRTAGGLGGM